MRHPLSTAKLNWLGLLLICLLLTAAACEDQPTPFPVNLPATPTLPPLPTAIPPVRYGLDPNTRDAIPDLAQLAAIGLIDQLEAAAPPDEPGIRFDILAAYGEWPGWTRSPITPQVWLVIRPDSLPEPAGQFAALIYDAVAAQAAITAANIPGAQITAAPALSVTALRARLANLGYPDGLQLAFGYEAIPGVAEIAAQLNAVNIDTRSIALDDDAIAQAFQRGQLDLALIAAPNPQREAEWQALYGVDYAFRLFSLPISYRAAANLTISFTPGGWPLGRW